jgi:YD repeat-containing protein
VDHHRTALPTGPEYVSRTTYDTNYGQPLTITEHYGTAKAATTTNVWTNAIPSWDTGKVSCLTQTTDPTGAVTKFKCNRAGDTIEQTVEVRALASQPQQTRTTTTAYDSMGRPVIVTGPPTEGTTINSYDQAGRLQQTKVEITSGVFAPTDLVYDHAGHLRTETLPDPDGGGSLLRPVVTHGWNWVDLETSMTDARGKTWSTSYDAVSRVVSETSPMGAVTTTTYQLGFSENLVVEDAPSGASTTTVFDLLGRKKRAQIEDYDETTYAYDVMGNATLTTDPAGMQTKTDFNGLGELLKKTEFFQATQGNHAITNFTYDVAGRLQQVDGPSSTPDDRITYGYDAVGRLINSTYVG